MAYRQEVDRQRWWGVAVVALVLLVAIIVPNVPARRAAGQPMVGTMPDPPSPGDCVVSMSDPWVHFDNPSLATREYVTRLITADAKEIQYTVFAYNPAIYSYEYSYLFKWIASKDVPYDPGINPHDSPLVYLIIPVETPSAEDFINSKTPNTLYKTIAKWNSLDGTIILKRIKK